MAGIEKSPAYSILIKPCHKAKYGSEDTAKMLLLYYLLWHLRSPTPQSGVLFSRVYAYTHTHTHTHKHTHIHTNVHTRTERERELIIWPREVTGGKSEKLNKAPVTTCHLCLYTVSQKCHQNTQKNYAVGVSTVYCIPHQDTYCVELYYT